MTSAPTSRRRCFRLAWRSGSTRCSTFSIRGTIWTRSTWIWSSWPTRWKQARPRSIGPPVWRLSSVSWTSLMISEWLKRPNLIFANWNLIFFISFSSQIQKEELRTLISSIKSLENCIQPFLYECDKDGNDVISDAEWGTCLDLSDGNLLIQF